jgi:ABC-type transport system involved in cytochrome c biogenesis permease subunit
MKSIILVFLKTMCMSALVGMSSFFCLAFLFQDCIQEILIASLVMTLLGGIIVCSHFVIVYLLIYHFNKRQFEVYSITELYDQFLPLALLPVSMITLCFNLAVPISILDNIEALLIILNSYLIIPFSFYQFIKSIKHHEHKI